MIVRCSKDIFAVDSYLEALAVYFQFSVGMQFDEMFHFDHVPTLDITIILV